jgi:predicted metalloprotease with PDZ domain
VVIDGDANEKANLVDGLQRIVSYETTLMKSAPFEEYLFLFHIGPYEEAGGGGMEHANCTAIGASSANGAERIAAHEFFHLWNVKRIRPASLQPVDYSREQYTRALWFAEGVTSTYASYALLRSGIWNRAAFYDDLAGQIADLDSRPARQWKSVEEASLDAWLEKYDFYARPDTSISYYNKGQIVGEMLDLTIRNDTDNHASLDDVMRRMNVEYAEKGKFYDDSNGVRGAAEEVAGRSLADFFTRYISGTSEIPYNEYLGLAGLQLRETQGESADLEFDVDRGPDGRSVVAAVAPGSAAQSADLAAGDVLLKINGEAFPRFISRWAREHLRPGESVRLAVERNGAQKTIQYAAGTDTQQHYEIIEIPNATAAQIRIREGWLKGTTN